MMYCPQCREEYEDEEFRFCTFDGVALFVGDPSTAEDVEPVDEPKRRWRLSKTSRIVIAIVLVVAGLLVVYSFSKRIPTQSATAAESSRPRAASSQSGDSGIPEVAIPTVNITQMSDNEVLRVVPRNLLRRFRPGENGEPRPEELRVFPGEKANYVVMVGTGRPGAAPTALDQVLILKHVDGEFQDVTRGALLGLAGSGSLGQNNHVRFDANGTDLVLRRPASSRAIVDECPQCEHAYQQITLEWKGSRFAEKRREWDNDRYTAFYVAAEALEKRRVDRLARPIIDRPLDPTIAEGFERASRRGWVVENLTDDQDASIADYELKNGSEKLVIRVARIEGKWRATRIIAR